jgi:hypothetical protein
MVADRLQTRSRAARWRFALGCALAVALLAALAEGFLELFPPRDLHPYLGDASPLTGIYQADDDFGVSYRSWEALRDDNAERLRDELPFESHDDGRPLWAFFGNSFVHAPGMLADTARATLPDRRVFNLGRNEPLALRLAQIKLLLENGLRPERIFVELMPVDVAGIGAQPLATTRVTARGALTYVLPHYAPPLEWLAHNTRLGLTACVRTGWQRGNPNFRTSTLYDGLGDPLLSDLRFLFANLARVAREHHVPVTVLLIPAYHQVRHGASFGFQDTLGPVFRRSGLDVFDPRAAFLAEPDPDGLFIPDRHFSDRGNRVLLTELLQHLERQPSSAVAQAEVP